MVKNTTKSSPSQTAIARVEPCDDTLSARGGLALFARYLDSVEIEGAMGRWVCDIKGGF